MDQFLDLPRMLHIHKIQMGDALVGRNDADRPHAENPLANRQIQLQIPDAVKQHLVAFQIQKPLFAEQTILTETVPGKGKRQPQMTFPIFPKVLNGFHISSSFPVLLFQVSPLFQ